MDAVYAIALSKSAH